MARLLATRVTPAAAGLGIARKSAPEIRVGDGWNPDRTRSAGGASVRGERPYAERSGGTAMPICTTRSSSRVGPRVRATSRTMRPQEAVRKTILRGAPTFPAPPVEVPGLDGAPPLQDELVLEELVGRPRDLDAARRALCLHPPRDVHGIAPQVVEEALPPDDARHH